MVYDIKRRIDADINLKRYLRENSSWYKRLNRSPFSFPYFANEMKVKYKLTPSDKINRTIDNINMLQGFLDVLKQKCYNFIGDIYA